MEAKVLNKNIIMIKGLISNKDIKVSPKSRIKIVNVDNNREEIKFINLIIDDNINDNLYISTDYNMPEVYKLFKNSSVKVINGDITLEVTNFDNIVTKKLINNNKKFENTFLDRILKWRMIKC